MTAPKSPHDQARELLGVYAMDNASPDEARIVERHVMRCSECHAELHQLIAATEALAFSPEQQAMPLHIHNAVMEAIAADDRDAATVVPDRARRLARANRWIFNGARGRRVLPAMAACLALAIITAGVQTARLADHDSQSRGQGAPQPVAPASLLDTSHVVAVDTSGALEASTMELVDVHGAGLLITKNLPDPPIGYEWRVWGVNEHHDMLPMGELAPQDQDGMGLQPITGLHDRPYDAVAVTLEPRNAGSEQRGPVVGWAQMT